MACRTAARAFPTTEVRSTTPVQPHHTTGPHMKRITCLYSVIVAGFLLAAFIVSVLVLAPTKKAIASPGRSIPSGPQGVIETDGTLDSTFDAGNFTNGLVLASAFQSDGKLLIAGQFTQVHGTARFGIARLNTDGTLDASFDPGTGSDLGVGGVAVQPDGKILIWKFFHLFNGDSGLASLVRLNSDGSTDSSFAVGHNLGGNTAFNVSEVFSVLLQADGKIVVGGQFSFVITPTGNVNRSRVARFNSDGSFDPTFDPGAGAVSNLGEENTFVFNAASQSIGSNAGKVIIQGAFDLFDNHPASGMARLNTDGSFDSTFNAGTAANGFSVFGVLVQSDDRPVVYGAFDSFNGTSCSDIVRLNTDGSVDSGFQTAAFKWYGNTATIFGAALQPDGKLVVGGDFYSLGDVTTNNVVRLNADGTQDATFSATGGGPSGENVSTVAVRPSDGKIFFGGNFSTYGSEVRDNVALANPDGTVDNSFAGGGGATDYNPNIWSMVVQPDGKILLTGYFNSVNGVPHNNILRLNPDATIDSSFNANTNRSTRGLLLQPDGKILISGNFGEVNGVPRSRIARLNSDGTLDPSFDPGIGPNRIVRALAEDSAGNVYAGGDFNSFNGLAQTGIVKLNSTGALDPVFNQGGGGATSGFVSAITPPDETGHLVFGGSFSVYNGTSAHRIARIDTTTGALDPTFNSGSGFSGTVYALQTTPDGKYYAGGNFTSFNGHTRRLVARLNNDGTLDLPFADTGMEGIIHSLAVQNGKVYAGGDNFFASLQSIMVRLTSGGVLDPTFNTGKGFDILPQYSYGQFIPQISALAVQLDGKLLVGGIFNRYNGTPRICLARLTGPLTPPSPTPSPSPSASPTPPAQALNLSTRMLVQTGENVGIGGLIITGTAPKHVVVRGIGPSLSGVPNPLADPVLELHGPDGFVTITNDNWQDPPGPPAGSCQNTGLPPVDDLEAAICVTLDPGPYTAIVKGKNDGTGIGLVEVYDIDPAASSKLANISTRARVNTGNDIVIAGFILGSSTSNDNVILRGIGPSLASGGVSNPLANPTLELRDGDGTVVRSDNNWQDDPTQAAIIMAAGLAPTNNLESAIAASLVPGPYTALLSGVSSGTGLGLVEVYDLATSGPLPSPGPSGTPATPTPGPTPSPALCTENWDSVIAPALPPGWVATNPDPGDGTMWVTTTTNPESPPNAVHITGQDGISEKVLDRMGVTITSTLATMSFRNNFNTEFSDGTCNDGYTLEVSSPNISNGEFLNIIDSHVGGSFVTGGYTCQSPQGRSLWAGNSNGYIDTVINMGPNLVGQTIVLRFHMVTDELSVAAPGVWIDNISITGATCP